MRKITPDEFKASMEKAIENTRGVDAEVIKAMRQIMEQREEILEAFVAKFGFDPEEAVQVEFKTPNGNPAWMIRKRTKDDPEV